MSSRRTPSPPVILKTRLGGFFHCLGTATAPVANGSGIGQVAFYSNGNFTGSASAAPYLLDWNNVPAGAYSLTAVATDTLGNSATSGAVAVTVVNNTAPAVTVTATPANVALGATAGACAIRRARSSKAAIRCLRCSMKFLHVNLSSSHM